MPLTIVLWILTVEAVLLSLVLGAIFSHAFWYRRALARRAALLDAGRTSLLAVLASGDAAGDLGILPTMPRRVLVRLLRELAPSLAGPHKDTIVALALRLGVIRFATVSLSSYFWWRRLTGARLLTLLGYDARGLVALSRDPHPLVRAQRAEALGQHPSPARAVELIAMLGDGDGAVRFVARDALTRLGAAAQAPILRRLEQREPAELLALLDVARAIPSTNFLAVALVHSSSQSYEVRARAATLLQAIGAGAAIDRLVHLLGDPSPTVRRVAASAIGALGHWPASVALSRLLDDPEWEVRMASSIALHRLGAPGDLLLRRARKQRTGLGAEAARQVLDIAGRLRIMTAS